MGIAAVGGAVFKAGAECLATADIATAIRKGHGTLHHRASSPEALLEAGAAAEETSALVSSVGQPDI